jgi:hypothetical protein
MSSEADMSSPYMAEGGRRLTSPLLRTMPSAPASLQQAFASSGNLQSASVAAGTSTGREYQAPGFDMAMMRRQEGASPPPPHAGARRILTPKSPRATSLTRAAAMRSHEGQPPVPPIPPSLTQHSQAPFPGSDQSRDMPSAASGRRPSIGQSSAMPFPGSYPGPGSFASPRLSAVATSPRSFSQPLSARALASSEGQEPQYATMAAAAAARDAQRRPAVGYPTGGPAQFGRPPPASSQDSFPEASPSRYETSAAPAGRWHGSAEAQGGGGGLGGPVGRTFSVPEGSDPMISLQLAPGENIDVPLDTHQASRQADEKRRRNAGASSRFRLRKKEKERQLQEDLQKSEHRFRDQTRDLEDLNREWRYWRDEALRLRSIVQATSGISHLANPSPASMPADPSTFGGEVRQAGPIFGSSSLQHPRPDLASYGGEDPEAAERPARRRRTDPNPHLPPLAQSDPRTAPPPPPPPPSTSGPFPGYGSSILSSQLSSTTSAGQAIPASRLPPLRLESALPGPSMPPTLEHPATSLPPPSSFSLPPPPTIAPAQHQSPHARPPPSDASWLATTQPSPSGPPPNPHSGPLGHR